MLMLSYMLATSLMTATPDVRVVVSRRTGISKGTITQVTGTLVEVLKAEGVNVADSVEDGVACNAKMPCLLSLSRKQHAAVVVLVEAALVVDDAVLRVEALSLEEDGKRLAVADYAGSFTDKKSLTSKLAPLVAGIKAALGTPAQPTPVAPPPLVVAPQPPPPPAPVVTTTPPPPPAPAPTPVVEPTAAPPEATANTTAPSTSMSGLRIAGLGVAGAGVVAGIVAGVFALQAAQSSSQVTALCPANPCHEFAAYTARDAAITANNNAVVTGLIAAGAVAAGAVLFFVGGNSTEPAKAAVWVTPSSAGLFVRF